MTSPDTLLMLSDPKSGSLTSFTDSTGPSVRFRHTTARSAWHMVDSLMDKWRNADFCAKSHEINLSPVGVFHRLSQR